MAVNIGPVDQVPAAGDPIRSAWANDISNLVAADWTTAGVSRAATSLTFTGGTTTTVTWATTLGDTSGYITDGTTFTIPAGMQGIYSIMSTFKLTTATTGIAHVVTTVAGTIFGAAASPAGITDFTSTIVMPLGAGQTVRVGLYNGGVDKLGACEFRMYRLQGSYV
jgi:hypothetical protein